MRSRLAKAAGYTGDVLLFVPEVLDTLDRLDQHGVDAVKILAQVAIVISKRLAFPRRRAVEYVRAVLIGVPDDLPADADELALDEFLQDDRECVSILAEETTAFVSLVT